MKFIRIFPQVARSSQKKVNTRPSVSNHTSHIALAGYLDLMCIVVVVVVASVWLRKYRPFMFWELYE